MGWIIGVSIFIAILFLACWSLVRINYVNTAEVNDNLDILLYDPIKVTLQDVTEMENMHNLKAILNDGQLLGFTQE